jgi:hypothetical protein
VRVDYVIKGTSAVRSLHCGRCQHEWVEEASADAVAEPVVEPVETASGPHRTQ